jgi:hypothetical protein
LLLLYDACLLVHVVQDALVKLKLGSTSEQDTKTSLSRVLRYSFDTLDSVAQAMFLDVATVYHGIPVGVALAVWKKLYSSPSINVAWCLRSLERRCLVDSRDGSLGMHDVLKYLGRHETLSLPVRPSTNAESSTAQQYAGSRLFVSNTTVMGRSQDSYFGRVPPDASGSLEVYGAQAVSCDTSHRL